MKPLSKNRLKLLHKLKQKKYRDSENLFIISGLRAVKTALESPHIHPLEAIFSRDKMHQSEVILNNSKQAIPQFWLTEKEFTKLVDEKTPQGICLVASKPSTRLAIQKISGRFLLFLDHINDPGNLGTIMRCAEWFGIKTILLSYNSVDPFHPKAVRSSAGTLLNLTILENVNTKQLMQLKKKGYKIVATDINDGRDIAKFKFPEKAIIQMGSEAHGLDAQYIPLCDHKISITRIGNGESLNLANAAAIIMYQAVNNEQ